MSFAAGPGMIVIRAASAGGRICSVNIVSTRPGNLAGIFRGRPASEVPVLAGRLFALCGTSQAVAAALAVASALGRPVGAAERRSYAVALWRERLTEILRASVLGWPSVRTDPPMDAATIADLREAVGALAAIEPGSGSEAGDGAALRQLDASIRRLGIDDGLAAGEPPRRGWFARLWTAVAEDRSFPNHVPDRLGPADDEAVVAALRADGAGFAAAPSLPGRIAETGAVVRRWERVPAGTGILARRLFARLFDVVETLAALRLALAGGEPGEPDLMNVVATGRRQGAREGAAAVETPRGRLYHWLALDRRGHVADYALLAPTEWNFHPAGPLTASLVGATVGTDEAARLRIARLAALFDPCVGSSVELRELARA